MRTKMEKWELKWKNGNQNRKNGNQNGKNGNQNVKMGTKNIMIIYVNQCKLR